MFASAISAGDHLANALLVHCFELFRCPAVGVGGQGASQADQLGDAFALPL
jgi:hypothetical protein